MHSVEENSHEARTKRSEQARTVLLRPRRQSQQPSPEPSMNALLEDSHSLSHRASSVVLRSAPFSPRRVGELPLPSTQDRSPLSLSARKSRHSQNLGRRRRAWHPTCVCVPARALPHSARAVMSYRPSDVKDIGRSPLTEQERRQVQLRSPILVGCVLAFRTTIRKHSHPIVASARRQRALTFANLTITTPF